MMIKMKQVSKSYGKGAVLNGLNFDLQQGQVMGLLGRNGAGKSTLMKLALGLARADYGEILTLGCRSNALNQDVKNRLGYVPQEIVGFDGMTIGSAFEFMAKHYSHWDKAFESSLTNQFDLVLSSQIGKLSGGQKQIVAIIMALAHKPDLLILDEPASALDPINRRQFLSIIIDLAIEHGSTVLFSTHITQDIERIASHVSFLSDGAIALQGELDVLKDQIYSWPLDIAVPANARKLKTLPQSILIECCQPLTNTNAKRFNLDDLFIALNQAGGMK